MSPDEFQQQCKRTERPESLRIDVETARMLHAAIGLCTEAGELQDMLKRHLFYGQPLNPVNLLEECGDALWYISIALDAAGYTLGQAMAMNVAKLAVRYPEGFTEDCAVGRDIGLEQKVLSALSEGSK